VARRFPPVSFYFRVDFLNLGNTDARIRGRTVLEPDQDLEKDRDIRFQSISGLNVDIETETIKEGGENRFEHKLPVRTKFSDLVLKRGIIKAKDSAVMDWCMQAFSNADIRPVDLLISLLNENHEPLMQWDVIHAWPKKWSVSDLNAEQSAFAIETLELYYNYFIVK
jgi:phage tail-like protein